MTKCAVNIAILVGFTVSAFAQIDGYLLREKYGPPLQRETFTVRPGIEMIVDYGPAKQVCRIQLPSGTEYYRTFPYGAITKTLIDEILEEVVPTSIRGKVIAKTAGRMGVSATSETEYEYVSMSELTTQGIGKGITVTFKNATCPKPNVQ